MVATQFLVAGLVAAASASSLVAREDAYFAALLKRQEPGTPAYDCHDNCGTAITLSRGSDPCNDNAFLEDYNNCLQCAGPDKINIWRYYGNTLSAAGAKCGLPTSPASGSTDNSATTAAAQSSAAAPSSAPAASSAAAPSSAAVPASSEAAATTEAATSEAPVSSAASSSAASSSAASSSAASAPAHLTTVVTPSISSAPYYPTAIANGTLSSVSGAPSASTNASASFTASAPAEVTTNAASGLRVVDAGIFGAIFVGALFGM